MLIHFKSSVTETITLFGDIGKQLLTIMGASGKVPGALSADEVTQALQRLETATERIKAQTHQTAAPAAVDEDSAADDDEDEKVPVVSLATRAIPLISLLKRAAAANVEVMWEAG